MDRQPHSDDGQPDDNDWDGLPLNFPADDFDADAEMARFIADIEAGRERIPAPWEVAGPAVSISLGDAADVDPALLAAMAGPDGLAGESFGQDGTADATPPGPVLAALVEQAAGDLDTLTDNQVLGLLSAARRLRNRADYTELRAIAEFTRRRAAQFEAAKAGKAPPGRRDGEFADSELALELITTRNAAEHLMGLATSLDTRLPRAFARLADGTIDIERAYAIWFYTRSLSAADAARADGILSAAAPDLREDQLSRRAAALEMKLDPQAARLRKEKARREDGRVEVRREASGNASLSGRELGLADVLSAKANVDALAARLRQSGMGGTLRELRIQVYMDLLQGRDPLTRLDPDTGQDQREDSPPDVAGRPDEAGAPDAGDMGYTYRGVPGAGRLPADGSPYVYPGADDEEDEASADGDADRAGADPARGDGSRARESQPGRPPAPLPALINFIVPVGTALGWSSAPGSVGSCPGTPEATAKCKVALRDGCSLVWSRGGESISTWPATTPSLPSRPRRGRHPARSATRTPPRR